MVEPKIRLSNGEISNPDLVCLLQTSKGEMSYVIIELKSIAKLSHNQQLQIEKQFMKYTKICAENLDAKTIPIIRNAEFTIIYLLIKSDEKLAANLIKQVHFNKLTSLLYFANKFEELKLHPKLESNKFCKLLVNSTEKKYQPSIIVPFTISDLGGIGGKSKSKIEIDVNFNLIQPLSHIFSFILERKIKNKPSEFYVNEVIDYIEEPFKNILSIDDEEKKGLTRIFRLLLTAIEQATQEKKIALLERVEGSNNRFILTFRKSRNLDSRLQNLEERVLQILDDSRRQENLKDFF